MKKLMIAVAAAAMIGGAQAADLWYDFSASVKTTAGKKGKETKATYKALLGKGDDGFWWKQIQNEDGEQLWATVDEAKAAVKKMNNDQKIALLAALNLSSVDANDKNEIAYGEKTEVKPGKVDWCTTFTFTETLAAGCYRVAGSRTIKGYVKTDDCCGATWKIYPYNAGKWAAGKDRTDGATYQIWAFDADDADAQDIANVLLYRFGAQGFAKSAKVEYLGTMGDATFAAEGYAFAGQGAWGNLGREWNWDADVKKVEYVDQDGDDKITTADNLTGVTSISGNIVGVTPAPTCFNCCDDGEVAIAFKCDAASDADVADDLTVAYGTWSMKFNKKYSNLK